MIDEDDCDDGWEESSENRQNAIELSSDAYGRLVRATADICSARYHYYCADTEANVPEQIVVVANTRKVPIKDNEIFRMGSKVGGLEAEKVENRGPDAVQFVPIKSRQQDEELQAWKDGLRSDFTLIDEACPQAKYICMPEFGFPYGLAHMESMEIPASADSDWRSLQEARFLTDRFVCLGSAHRRFYRAEGGLDLQYENIAVVYPSGFDQSLEPNDIFSAKLAKLHPGSKVADVDFSFQLAGRGITASFSGDRLSAARRSDLSGPKAANVDGDKIRYAKDAFDFYDVMAEPSAPPTYIRKKSPARKLGEYIDANGKIELDIFVTKAGVVAVLICYDAFDPSIFLSAVRMFYESLDRDGRFVHQAIDIFFIPAFNRSQKFVDMCEVLSRETNSVVVYVSGDERCEVKSNVFAYGHPCNDWAVELAKGASPDIYYKRDHVKGHEHLHIHTFSTDIIRAAKRFTTMHASPKMRRSLIMGRKSLGAGALG